MDGVDLNSGPRSCVTEFFLLSCVLDPCLFALYEHRLAILVNIIFRENAWSSNGQATHNAGPMSSLSAPSICWPRLPVGVGQVGPLFCFVLSQPGCAVCLQRTVILSPSHALPSESAPEKPLFYLLTAESANKWHERITKSTHALLMFSRSEMRRFMTFARGRSQAKL